MVQATFVDKTSAPESKRTDARRDGRMNEYDELMVQVINANGQVLKLPSSSDDSARAIRLRVAQSINRLEKSGNADATRLHAWTGSDDAVYVELKPTAAASNGTEPTSEPNTEPDTEAATSGRGRNR
jgi:hypothetical protein